MKPSIRTVENAYTHTLPCYYSLVQPANFKAFTGDEIAALVGTDVAVRKLECNRVLLVSVGEQFNGEAGLVEVNTHVTRELAHSDAYDFFHKKIDAVPNTRVFGKSLICPAAMIAGLSFPAIF